MSAICFYVVFGAVFGQFVAFALGSLSVIFVILLLCAWSGCRQLAPAVVALARIASSIFSHSLFVCSCVGCVACFLKGAGCDCFFKTFSACSVTDVIIVCRWRAPSVGVRQSTKVVTCLFLDQCFSFHSYRRLKKFRSPWDCNVYMFQVCVGADFLCCRTSAEVKYPPPPFSQNIFLIVLTRCC